MSSPEPIDLNDPANHSSQEGRSNFGPGAGTIDTPARADADEQRWQARGGVPKSPDRFERELRSIVAAAARPALRRQYREAHEAAYTDDRILSAEELERRAAGGTGAKRSGHVSDPAGNLATDKRKLASREHLAEACELVRQARQLLHRALDATAKAYRTHNAEPPTLASRAAVSAGDKVPVDEYEALRAAQSKRAERGEE